MRGRGGSIAWLVLVLLALGGNVSATEDAMHDPDDTSVAIDIKRISHSHGDESVILKHRIVAYDDWKSSALERVRSPWHYSSLEMAFDLSGNACPEAKLSIIKTKKGLKAFAGPLSLFGCPDDTYMYYDPTRIKAHITRPNDRSIVVTFRKGAMGINKKYSWSAGFSVETDDGADCEDSAPDKANCFKGFLEHDLSD